ncbi:hypothetical protein [Corynebacterium lowii]|nr:hypothetical protein [Corynebacterium lowii]MDP9852360.1 hypothetical protein [Corynebacterium lowii]
MRIEKRMTMLIDRVASMSEEELEALAVAHERQLRLEAQAER